MAATTSLSVEEYLHTSFENPDREYRDGELVERAMPDSLHGSTQALLAAFFVAVRMRLGLYVRTETRVKLREGLYLIPDVSVFWPDKPPLVPDVPPLISIEILSNDDRATAVRAKLDEYRAWGVPHVWLVDPYLRKLYTCDTGLTEVPTLRIPELDLELRPEHVFE
jgi:Uma2 family endonuclease